MCASAHVQVARVGQADRRIADDHINRYRVCHFNRDVRSQLVNFELLGQIVRPLSALAVEKQRFIFLTDEKIVQEFAVGGEKAGVDQGVRVQKVDIVGDQTLQEFPAIRAGYPD